MHNLKSIIRIHKREGSPMEKNAFQVVSNESVLEYVENNKVQKRFSFSEVSYDTKHQKQFVEKHITDWIDKLQKGESQFVFVAGKEVNGRKYLLKGTNSVPGIISLTEKKLVALAGESKMSTKVSYLRFKENSFWDILSTSKSSVSLTQKDTMYSFSTAKYISLLGPESVSSISNSIKSSLKQHYKDYFSSTDYSLWIFKCRMRTTGVFAYLYITDISLDNEEEIPKLTSYLSSYIHCTDFTFQSTFYNSISLLLQPIAEPSLILCINSLPSISSMALLDVLSLKSNNSIEEEEKEHHQLISRVSEVSPYELDSSEDEIIPFLSSGSDSCIESDEEEDSSDSHEEKRELNSLYETPKKSIKRIVQRSTISNKVYKSNQFSPSSRSKIYQNETRLSMLLNGKPVLSPCSRVVQAKKLIIKGREYESEGSLNEALQEYEDEYLPDNELLQKKVNEIKNRIELISSTTNDDKINNADEEHILQILNYAGLSGLVKLKTIGEAKAARILSERQNGLFTSINDLERIGFSENGIKRFRKENNV